MPVKFCLDGDYNDIDDFGLTKFNGKGSGGSGKRNLKDKSNPDGKYSSKHVRISQSKKEKSEAKRPHKQKEENK